MKTIRVLGPGCAKCKELHDLTNKAVAELDLDCTVEKVTDITEIMNAGVMMTPALVVDGEVIVTGKVPKLDELKKLLS